MTKGVVLPLFFSAALVAGFVVALRAGVMPLGVRGEWEWLRVPFSPSALDVLLASVGVAAYAAFAGLVRSLLGRGAGAVREAIALLALLVASVTVQAVVPSGAPTGYGLAKWAIILHEKGSSGYFQVAKNEVDDPWTFLAEYPKWIVGRDALHIGTHPPGLILLEAVLLRAMERSPGMTRFVEDHIPNSVTLAFRVYERNNPMTPADRATLALTGMLTLFCCAATVVPLYALARASLPAPAAWSVAALWPLVPSAVLFHPTADTAFPLFSTAALALAAHAGLLSPRPGRAAAVVCGVVLGIGMQFTLAFLAVGLIVALVLASAPGRSLKESATLILATGVGFLGLTFLVWLLTRANPFVVWWWNLQNHARFYVEYPRSYLAWVLANPVELAVALGLPVAVWAAVGFARPRGLSRTSLAAASVLVLLTLSGKNLSEVARLWLPIMPALIVAAGHAFERTGAGAKSLAATIALAGVETLTLQATIQVVYPV